MRMQNQVEGRGMLNTDTSNGCYGAEVAYLDPVNVPSLRLYDIGDSVLSRRTPVGSANVGTVNVRQRCPATYRGDDDALSCQYCAVLTCARHHYLMINSEPVLNASTCPDGWAVNVPFYDGPDVISLATPQRAKVAFAATNLASEQLNQAIRTVGRSTAAAAEAMGKLGVSLQRGTDFTTVRLKPGPRSFTADIGIPGGPTRFMRGQAYLLAPTETERALATGRFDVVEGAAETEEPGKPDRMEALRHFFFGGRR